MRTCSDEHGRPIFGNPPLQKLSLLYRHSVKSMVLLILMVIKRYIKQNCLFSRLSGKLTSFSTLPNQQILIKIFAAQTISSRIHTPNLNSKLGQFFRNKMLTLRILPDNKY